MAWCQLMDDRRERKHRRFRLECPVLLKFQFDGSTAEVKTFTENASICGLLVRSSSMIPQNTPVTFIISIQGEQAIHPIYLAGQGHVVRVECSGADTGFAIAICCEMPITQLDEYLFETRNAEDFA